jgi:hypothetical protein
MKYKRGQRWKRSEDGKSYKLGIGSGDEAEYTIDDLLNFIRPALFQFVDVIQVVVDFYIEILEHRHSEIASRTKDVKT